MIDRLGVSDDGRTMRAGMTTVTEFKTSRSGKLISEKLCQLLLLGSTSTVQYLCRSSTILNIP